MGQRHGMDVLSGVELPVGKLRYLWVHASLPVQDTDEVVAPGSQLLTDKAFEERILTVAESDVQKQRISDSTVSVTLLHNGGKLLVVADEDEFKRRGIAL